MSSSRLPFLLILWLLLAASADATTVAVAKPAASQPAARPWATRDQLRECLAQEDALKGRLRDIDAAHAAHDALFDRVEAENARLLEVQGQLDHDSTTAVHAFNLLVSDHNLHVKQMNQEAGDLQAVSGAYNDDMLAVNRKCSPLAYRVEDMDAVLKERKKAAAAASAATP
jgi:hypothetical protein